MGSNLREMDFTTTGRKFCYIKTNFKKDLMYNPKKQGVNKHCKNMRKTKKRKAAFLSRFSFFNSNL